MLQVEEVGAVFLMHSQLLTLMFNAYAEAAYSAGDDLYLLTLNGWTQVHPAPSPSTQPPSTRPRPRPPHPGVRAPC